MAGYIKTSIDFDQIQKDIDAAKALENAGRTDDAKRVLLDAAEKMKKEAS